MPVRNISFMHHITGHEYICGREYISYTVNAVKERVAAESSYKKSYTN